MRGVGAGGRQVGVVAVDIPLSDIEDLVRTSAPLGSHLHTFVVDRTDQTVLVHPFFKTSFQVSPYCGVCITICKQTSHSSFERCIRGMCLIFDQRGISPCFGTRSA